MRPLLLAQPVLGVSAMLTDPPAATAAIAVDPAMVATYAAFVFGWCDGWVAVRALAEKGGPERPPHTPFLPADTDLPAKLAVQAQWAADAGMALYVIPGTVTAAGLASAGHVAQMQVILVDLDQGDIAAKRAHLVHHLGAPGLEVVSGGVTPEGQAKLHLYWRLTEPASGTDIAAVCRLRHAIAVKAGGDPAFRSAHQPIRVAGSLHAKGGNRRLVAMASAEGLDRDLAEFTEAVMAMPPLPGVGSDAAMDPGADPLDFNGAATARGEVADLFGQRIREGGADGVTRFEALSRIIGYWIRRCREGHATPPPRPGRRSATTTPPASTHPGPRIGCARRRSGCGVGTARPMAVLAKPGAQLARIEAQEAFAGLLRRLPGMELPERDAPSWRRSFNLRGLTKLPASWN